MSIKLKPTIDYHTHLFDTKVYKHGRNTRQYFTTKFVNSLDEKDLTDRDILLRSLELSKIFHLALPGNVFDHALQGRFETLKSLAD